MSLLPSTSYARNASAPVLLADGLLAGSETGDGVQPKSEPDKVTEDKLDRLGPIMSDIGGVAAEIVGGDPDGLYIYAEPARGVVHAEVYKEDPNGVRVFAPTDELADLIGEAWELESPDETKRWVAIEYEVRGTKFDVRFIYPEELDPKHDASDRRNAAVRRRFGNKPVIYRAN
ncbi:hypothetical protein SH591_05755 [Sphingomonas sp. LY54]|uniref:hypothetical protein n=1 Tax=Sphingomonas sp. LY54 TaxID=3095343 RepID=UPI002D77D6CE|nr:hypothetical protein [Sphingomonas sp. LY54]WRP29684.1 hypothetical protein SH591_05755 [Sphingomonas sp. LY54]